MKWDGYNYRLKTTGKRLQKPMVMDQIHWGEKVEKELKPDNNFGIVPVTTRDTSCLAVVTYIAFGRQ